MGNNLERSYWLYNISNNINFQKVTKDPYDVPSYIEKGYFYNIKKYNEILIENNNKNTNDLNKNIKRNFIDKIKDKLSKRKRN